MLRSGKAYLTQRLPAVEVLDVHASRGRYTERGEYENRSAHIVHGFAGGWLRLGANSHRAAGGPSHHPGSSETRQGSRSRKNGAHVRARGNQGQVPVSLPRAERHRGSQRSLVSRGQGLVRGHGEGDQVLEAEPFKTEWQQAATADGELLSGQSNAIAVYRKDLSHRADTGMAMLPKAR
jgi:hypothetical protein